MTTRIIGELHFYSTRKYNNGKKECFQFVSLDHNDKNKYLVAFKNKSKYTNNIYIIIEELSRKNSNKFNKFKYGKLIKVIGQIDDFNIKYEVLFYKYNFITKKQDFELIEDTNYRLDLRDYETISIDPKGSKDIDDALSIVDNKIYIHIADPTSYIKLKPMMRYSTIYNHRVVNMYNDEIGYDICSLIQNKTRNAITFIYDIDKDRISSTKLSIISVNRNLSYDDSDPVIDKLIDLMKDKLIDCDEEDLTHKIIEKLMVSVNLYTGHHLALNDTGIFRNYEIADVPTLSKNEELNKFLTIIKGNSAEYSLIPKRHEYLGLNNYCHFTSPLRRYVDTLNHLIFKHFILSISVKIPLINNELLEIINEFEKNHRRLNRDKNLLDLQKEVGDEIVNFEGYIIGEHSVMLSAKKIIVYVREIDSKFNIYDKVKLVAYTMKNKFHFFIRM